MSESQDNTQESPVSMGNNDFSRYLMDRIKMLEERNTLLKEQTNKIEMEKRFTESQVLNYEREIRQLKSELERIKTPPLVVGTVVDVLDGGKVIIRSSTGPQFVVGSTQFINNSELVPGTSVSLNYQSLAVVGILPSSRDPFVHGMEVIGSPNVSYSDIGGLEEPIRELRETVELPLQNRRYSNVSELSPPRAYCYMAPPEQENRYLQKPLQARQKQHLSGSWVRNSYKNILVKVRGL